MRVSEALKLQRCSKEYEFSKLNLRVKDEMLEFYLNLHEYIKSFLASTSDKDIEAFLISSFSEDNFKREWFDVSGAYEEEKKYQMSLYRRFLKHMVESDFKILKINEGFTVNKEIGGEDEVTGLADFIVWKDNNFQAIKLKRGKPQFSYRARKLENKIDYSLELILMKLGLEKTYPGIEVSLFYLKNKDDKRSDLVEEFNHKKGKNIISTTFEGLNEKDLLDRIDTVLFFGEDPNCDFCSYFSLCQKSEVKLPKVIEKEKKINKKIKLSTKQRAFVDHIDGAMRGIAGPGAGKTTVLVERLANLMEKGVNPKKILFLTFTKKACEEIKDRVKRRIDSHNLPVIQTFNSFGYKLLKKHKKLLGYEKLKLATKIDRYKLLLESLDEVSIPNMTYSNLYHPKYGLLPKLDKMVEYCIERDFHENILLTPLDRMAACEDLKIEEDTLGAVVRLSKNFYEKFEEKGFINYSQQLKLTNLILEKFPKVKKEYSNKYKYIMVDEFQDVDDEQAKLVYTLASDYGNLVVVGDDDQAIFSFRNGSNKHFLEMHKHFDCVDIILNDNYRSTKKILEYSNKLISNNKERFSKMINSNKSSGFEPVIKRESSYDAVVELIDELINDGENPGDIAVIARNNSTLFKLADKLDGKSYNFNSPKDYLIDDPVFRGILSYLETIFTLGSEDLPLYAILSSHYGLSREDIKGKSKDISLYNFLISKNNPSISSYLDDLLILSKIKEPLGITQYISYRLFGFIEHPVINELEELIDDYETDIEGLYHLMKDMVLCHDDTRLEGLRDKEGVNLLTAHDSKGKEFKNVIIIKLNDFLPEGGRKEEEEERRLLYVAMTRAKERLYLFEFKSRKKASSPFIEELVV